MAFTITDNASDLAALVRLFPATQGFEGNQNGIAFWGEALEAGLAFERVVEKFTLTRDFAGIFPDDATDAEFAETALARFTGSADPAEIDAIVADIAGGASRAEVIAGLARSAEAQSFIDVTAEGPVEIPDFDQPGFRYGVASGDPDATSVVLWTALTDADEATETVTWEVSTTADFSDVVASGMATTSADEDYTVKVIAEGLEAGGEYFYRFASGGETSATGATKTLPEGALDMLTLAVFSCANYTAGFFNPYAEAALRGFDFSVFLGDYIYESAASGFGSETGSPRVPRPLNEVVTPEDYALRHQIYLLDKDLQAVRSEAPMIMMWDDHETANDAWETGAEAHDPATEGDWFERRDAGIEAYHRWNPTREPENPIDFDRSFDFGDLATLHMLETRLQARDETRSDLAFTALPNRAAEYAADPTGQAFVSDLLLAPDLIPEGADLTDPATVAALASNTELVIGVAINALLLEAADPERDMIGDAQLAEFQDRVAASDATWQVIGSQTLINAMTLPSALLLDPTNAEAFAVIAQKIGAGEPLTDEETALLTSPPVPYNLDAWDGYQAEQEAIAQTLIDNDANAIVLAGDTHNGWFSTFSNDAGELAAYQFAGPGVSAPGLELQLGDFEPELVAQLFVGFVESLLYANTKDRGYLEVTFTPEAATSDYIYVTDVGGVDYDVFVDTHTVGIELFA